MLLQLHTQPLFYEISNLSNFPNHSHQTQYPTTLSRFGESAFESAASLDPSLKSVAGCIFHQAAHEFNRIEIRGVCWPSNGINISPHELTHRLSRLV